MRPQPIPVHDHALKHGIDPEDARHAYRHAWVTASVGEDPDKELVIGPDRSGLPLQVVVANPRTDEALVIHSMKLTRAVREKYLS